MVASLLALEICAFFFHPFEVTVDAIAITVPVCMVFIPVLLLLLLYIEKKPRTPGTTGFFRWATSDGVWDNHIHNQEGTAGGFERYLYTRKNICFTCMPYVGPGVLFG